MPFFRYEPTIAPTAIVTVFVIVPIMSCNTKTLNMACKVKHKKEKMTTAKVKIVIFPNSNKNSHKNILTNYQYKLHTIVKTVHEINTVKFY